MLKAHPKLIYGDGIKHVVKLLNQRVRRAVDKGETLGMSLDDVSARLSVDKLRFDDDFEQWIELVGNRVSNAKLAEMFYCFEP